MSAPDGAAVLAPLTAVPGVRWSVCVRDAGGGVVLEHRPDDELATASIGKLFLLLEVARRLADGRLPADVPLHRHERLLVADSGLWQHLASDALLPADLAVLVGSVSDNLATNALLEAVGPDAVAALTASLGVVRSGLHDYVRDVRGPQHPPALSTGCAGELSAVVADLAAGRGPAADVAPTVLDWLATGTDLSMVAAAFGLDPLAHVGADRGVRLVNKTGTNTTVRADVGVVDGPAGRLAWAVLANWDAGSDPRDAVLAAMAGLGAWLRARVGG